MATVIVENQFWLKVTLVGGIGGFIFGGVGSLFSAYTSPTSGEQVVMLGCGVFFLGVVLVAVKLIPYLHHRLELEDTGVRVIAGLNSHTLSWSSLRLRLHDALQIAELLDTSGRRIYAVGYWAHNAPLLVQRIRELEKQRATALNERMRAERESWLAVREPWFKTVPFSLLVVLAPLLIGYLIVVATGTTHWVTVIYCSIVLYVIAPLLPAFAAVTIAHFAGCELHEGFKNPCIICGRDIGGTLYRMFVFGLVGSLVSFSAGALAAVVFSVFLAIHKWG